MLRAETNIITEYGTIPAGEAFNPDKFRMPKEEVERLIGIGSVSRRDEIADETKDGSSAVRGEDTRKTVGKVTRKAEKDASE